MLFLKNDYTREDKIGVNTPIWGFEYQLNSIKRATYKCKPVLGLLTYEYNLEKEVKTRNKTDEQLKNDGDRICCFVPFKKNRTSNTIYDLAWSKATDAYNRDYSDDYDEAVTEYNKRVSKHIVLLEDRIEELKSIMV